MSRGKTQQAGTVHRPAVDGEGLSWWGGGVRGKKNTPWVGKSLEHQQQKQSHNGTIDVPAVEEYFREKRLTLNNPRFPFLEKKGPGNQA